MSTTTIKTCESDAKEVAKATSCVNRRVPDVDLYEKNGTLVLLVDMPGVTDAGVDLEIEAHTLTLVGTMEKGNRSESKVEYYRKFTLADDADRDAITASMNQGVLRVELPNKKRAPSKKITVTSDTG